MNDLISNSNFFISLLHCKKLTLESFEIIAEHLENYPVEVNMDIVKKQIEYRLESYKKDLEKYKRKYKIAKSGLTKEERNTLIELICNEQIKHCIPNNEHESEKYNMLEELKAKIRIM